MSIVKSLLAGCLLSVAASQAFADGVTLRYSRWLPPTYVLESEVVVPWIDQVAKVTEGRVTVEVLPKIVGTVPSQYDVVSDGLADLAMFVPGYSPGRFPLVEGLELPFFGDDVAVRAPASWSVYEKHLAPLGVFDKVHLLSIYVTNAGQLLTTNAPPTTYGELAGMKVRVNSPLVSLTELLGATPVVKPVSEIYELASGKMIDGTIIPPDTAIGYRLAEVMKGVVQVPGGLGTNTIALAINKTKWDQISPEDQKAIMALSGGEMARVAGLTQKDVLSASYAAFESAGAKLLVVDEGMAGQIESALKPLEAEWIAKAKAAGLADPEALLSDLRSQIGG